LGLHQAGSWGEGKHEVVEVAGDAKTRLDAIDDAEVVAGDGVTEACARCVSRAKLDDLAGTTVEAADSEEEAEHMDVPRAGVGRKRGDRRDLGTCDNSPTNPGPLACVNSKAGLKPSMVPGANEYSEPGK
jgi:hypothetical protein